MKNNNKIIINNKFPFYIFCSTDSNAVENMDFSDEIEWDTKTLASSVKAYFA